MWKLTAAKIMRKKKSSKRLRADQRERMQDTMQLVQSAREILAQVDPGLVPEREAIKECFNMADRSLRDALRSD